MTFLGYEIDSIAMEARLPLEKLKKVPRPHKKMLPTTKAHFEKPILNTWNAEFCLCCHNALSGIPGETDLSHNRGLNTISLHTHHKTGTR